MDDDFKINIEYWLSVCSQHKSALYVLRKWPHLKIAITESRIWLRGFTKSEIESKEVLKIPMIERYYLKATQLIPYGKYLPEQVEPSLLWSPIQRGLKIQLPRENFNFFGLDQAVEITISPSCQSHITDATIVNLEILELYLSTAPKIRLKHMDWVMIDKNKALVIGTPLLPIEGRDLYVRGCFLIPSGWKLEYECLESVFKKALGESREYWYLIEENNQIFKLRKSDFNTLSKGAFVNTIKKQ